MQKEIKFKKNLILKRIIFFIMLIATFYIIFSFSGQDGEMSGTISEKVTKFIVDIFSKFKTMDEGLKLHYVVKLHPIIRKLAHFSIYTVVGFSIMGFMCTFNIRNIVKFLVSLGIGITYAISDEIHQSFIPGRGPSVTDVCIDSLGVITGIFLLVMLLIFVRSIEKWLKKECNYCK